MFSLFFFYRNIIPVFFYIYVYLLYLRYHTLQRTVIPLKLFAYFIIPLYTLLFARGYGWFTTNFSVIASSLQKGTGFAIWGILISLYLYFMHRRLKAVMQLPKGCRFLLPASLVLLFCAVTTPYLPNDMPLKAYLHIAFAFVFGVLVLVYFLWIITIQYRQSPLLYRPLLVGIIGIIIGSCILFLAAGIVSSALETFLTITISILAYRLWEKAAGTFLSAAAVLPLFPPVR